MTYADHNLRGLYEQIIFFLTFIYLSLPLTPTNPSIYIIYIYDKFVCLAVPSLVMACGI